MPGQRVFYKKGRRSKGANTLDDKISEDAEKQRESRIFRGASMQNPKRMAARNPREDDRLCKFRELRLRAGVRRTP